MSITSKSPVRKKNATRVLGRMNAPTTHFVVPSADQASGQVRFGRVVVEAETPSAVKAKRNIAEGHLALNRAKNVLLKPGVQVHVASDIPLYHADPTTPGLLVRTLNGRTMSGRLVGGRFKPT